MGAFVNHRATTAVAAAVAVLIIGLNLFLIGQTVAG
jgi:Mn2+/Fe2+ NRAMP family transporter